MLYAEHEKSLSVPSCLNTTETREVSRLTYLDAMGIQTWFPRKALINAQPARLFEWLTSSPAINVPGVASEQPSQTEPVKHPTTEAPPAQHPSSRDILNSVNNPSTTKEQQRAPIIAEPAPSTITSQAKPASSTFRLSIMPLDPDGLVIAEMPYAGTNPFTHYHHRLLQDLSKALKLPLLPAFQTAREFTWPLTSSTAHSGLFSQINQDDQAATDAIKAYLNNQFGFARRQVILLLGQAAAHFVFDRSRSFEELRGIHTTEGSKQVIAISHGLHEMMKIPSLKPETWQDLQKLCSINFKSPLDDK